MGLPVGQVARGEPQEGAVVLPGGLVGAVEVGRVGTVRHGHVRKRGAQG